jgi:branched-chain amino acid transport system substrate-binding protein
VAKRRWLAAAALAVSAVAGCGAARAQSDVTIGAIFPLTRRADARAAVEAAAEIVNQPHRGLEALPLGAGQGLPNLRDGKLAVSFADDLDNPSVARAQALRLTARSHVAALIGAGEDAATLADSHGAPFLVAEGETPSLARRSLGAGFRLGPDADAAARVYAGFLQEAAKARAIALVFEDSDFGRSRAGALGSALKAAGFAATDVSFPTAAIDLTDTVAQLRAVNPDAAIVIAHADAAILLAKTMNTLGYKPPVLIGDGAGFSDAAFVPAAGNLVQGLVNRSVWNPGPPGSPTAIVNDLYKARSGRDLDDRTARIVQGVLVLAEAIDRAGSSDAEAVRTALRQTDLRPDQLIVGYDGVKFDATGRNALAATYLTQLRGKKYVTVWPAAEAAPALPDKGGR